MVVFLSEITGDYMDVDWIRILKNTVVVKRERPCDAHIDHVLQRYTELWQFRYAQASHRLPKEAL